MVEGQVELAKRESFIRNSFWNGLVIFLAKMGGMLFVVLLARFLLPEKFGIYILALSVPFFLVSLTNTAINQTASRYMADSLKSNNLALTGTYFKFCLNLKIIFSIITFALLLLIAYPLSAFIFKKPDLFLPLIIFSFYIPLLSIQTLYETVFYVVGKVNFLTVKEILLQLLKLGICLGLFFFISASVSFAILAILLSSLSAIWMLHIYLKKNYSFLFNKEKAHFDRKRVKNFIKSSIFSSIFSTAFENLDIIFLGIFVTSAYAGQYSAAILIVGGFYGLLNLASLSLPLFTQTAQKGIKDVFDTLLKYLSLITIPVIFGIAIWGKDILLLLYGETYSEATPFLICLSLLIFESAITGTLRAFLLAKEKPEVITRVMAICTGLHITLSLSFALIFSSFSMFWIVMGVVFSFVISRFTTLILLSRSIKQTFNLQYKLTSLVTPLLSSTLMLASVFLLRQVMHEQNLLTLILEATTGGLVYLLSLLLFKGVDKQDFFILKDIITKKKNLQLKAPPKKFPAIREAIH